MRGANVWLAGIAAMVLMAASGAAQTVLQVSSTADPAVGSPRVYTPGTLRWAVHQVAIGAAGSYAIEILPGAVTAPIVLLAANGALDAIPVGRTLQLRSNGTTARLVLDVRAVPIGLVVLGAGAQLQTPLRILVQAGVGLVVRGNNSRLDDVEIQGTGSSAQAFLAQPQAPATALAGLVVGRLVVSGAPIGALLQNCTGARLGSATAPVVASGCSNVGIAFVGGSDCAVRWFQCTGNQVGLRASTGASRLLLGDATAPRSTLANNSSHGCDAAGLANAGQPLLVHTDCTGNGGYGANLSGCSAASVADLTLAANGLGGLLLDGSASQITVGPNVTTLGPASGVGAAGVNVRAASSITFQGCQFGPGHSIGLSIGRNGSTAVPSNVVVNGCRASGNTTGIGISNSSGVQLVGTAVEDCTGTGIDAVATATAPVTALTISGCTIRRSAVLGLSAHLLTGFVCGPGNAITGNGWSTPAGLQYGGAVIVNCPGFVFGRPAGAPPTAADNIVDGNPGVALDVTTNATFRIDSTRCTRSTIAGLRLQDCSNATLGPGLEIAQNVGFGLQIGGTSSAIALRQAAIHDNYGGGIDASSAAGTTLRNFTLGPGVQILDNVGTGCHVQDATSLVVAGDRAGALPNLIQDNHGSGLEIVRCPGARVRDLDCVANAGFGIWNQLDSNNAQIGPGVFVRDIVGTGIQIESAGGVLLVGCRIANCSAAGVGFLSDGRLLAANTMQSCAVYGGQGIGIHMQHAPPLHVQACTITANLRGVVAAQLYRGQPVLVDLESCIAWGNFLEDLSATSSSGQVTAVWSFFRLPMPSGGNNRGGLPGEDPLFVDAAAGDVRLQPGSPAIDAADPALAFPVGSVDAFGRPRVAYGPNAGPPQAARMDCGAYEWGNPPRLAPALALAPATMPVGGGDIAFGVQYPAADAGALSLLLLEYGPPSGSFEFGGASIPLAWSPLLLGLAEDVRSTGVLGLVPTGGFVGGTIRWAGRVPVTIRNQTVSLCAVSLDAAAVVRTVSRTASFAIQ